MYKTPNINIKHTQNIWFVKNIFWNLFDTIFTQLILIANNILLQKFIGQYFHGLLSTILAIFYFLTIVLNLGLDYTLPLFIKSYTQNKKDFINFIKIIILPQCILITSFSILAGFLLILINRLNIIPINFSDNIDSITIVIISITFILESIRKTLRSFLQLVLASKITALTETISTYLYISILWISYLANINITIKYCFILLLSASIAQNALLIYAFYKYYLKVLDINIDNKTPLNTNNRFIKSRLYNMAAQLSSQALNCNFLLPICSLYFDLNKTSSLKIYFSIAQFASLIIIKNLSIILNTLFLHNPVNYKKLFKNIVEILYQIIYFILIFLIINNNININFNFIIFLIVLIEPFFIFYEKVFILEKSTIYIFILNLVSIFSSMFLIYNYKLNYFNLNDILMLIFLFRTFSIVILSLISLVKTKVRLNIKPNIKFIIFYFLISFLYRLFI